MLRHADFDIKGGLRTFAAVAQWRSGEQNHKKADINTLSVAH
jgi:hypothetical protein